MTEVTWGNDPVQAPKKRLVPGWVWMIGGGCLLMLVIGGGACIWLVSKFREYVDSEKQWVAIDEVLPFDEQPQGLMVLGVPLFTGDARMWMMTDARGARQAILLRVEGAGAEQQRRELFDATEKSADVPWIGAVGRIDPQGGTLSVQGRTLPTLRYHSTDDSARDAGEPAGERHLSDKLKFAMSGSTIVVDLSPPGARELTALILSRPGTREPIRDEEVTAFLAPFRVGPERQR